MKHRYSKFIGISVFILDLLLFNFSYLVAYHLYASSFSKFFEQNNPWLLLALNLSFIILSLLGKLFNISRTSTVSDVVRLTLRFLFLHLLFVTALLFFVPQFDTSRTIVAFTYGISAAILIFYRSVFIYSIRIYRKYGFNYRNVAIVGFGDVAMELKKFFKAHPEFGYNFIGFYDDSTGGNTNISSIAQLKEVVDSNRIDEIYCCVPYINYSQVEDIIDFAEKNLIKVKLLTDFRGFRNKNIVLENYENIPVLSITSLPLEVDKNRAIKRAFDIIFSLIVILLVFSWLFPLIALAIKLDSKGPVFFKQKRSGKSNSSFWCLKFRTMKINKDCHIKQALLNDGRITRIGSFLRKTSLDELPQFINVLLGNMSVVGPRPHMLYHTEAYSKKVERFMARHFVKPGITGLAQAKGYRGETSSLIKMKNRVKFDRFYIQNWSLLLDIKIIFLTIVLMIRGDENAY